MLEEESALGPGNHTRCPGRHSTSEVLPSERAESKGYAFGRAYGPRLGRCLAPFRGSSCASYAPCSSPYSFSPLQQLAIGVRGRRQENVVRRSSMSPSRLRYQAIHGLWRSGFEFRKAHGAALAVGRLPSPCRPRKHQPPGASMAGKAVLVKPNVAETKTGYGKDQWRCPTGSCCWRATLN